MRQLLLQVALALGSLLIVATSTAQEPARLALLIGNKGYTEDVGPLTNPHNDVDLIAAALRKLGFEVTVRKDANYRDMDSALKRYVAQVRRAGQGALSFFYYSGHGIANPDTQINYLIPVDVKDANDDNLWYNSIEQGDIINKLSRRAPGATHYVIFDACRNELRLSSRGKKSLGAEKGFVPVAQTAGLLIAYATAPKQTASDVGEGGGPYAKALAAEIVKPGVEAVNMFRRVQVRVKQSTGQDPWLSFPSLPEVYLARRYEEEKYGNGIYVGQPPKIADVGMSNLRRSAVYIEVPFVDAATGVIEKHQQTGFIISKAGYLLTGYDSVKKWIKAQEKTPSWKEKHPIIARIGDPNSDALRVHIVSFDSVSEIALLKLQSSIDFSFEALPVCRRDSPILGETLVAGGFPKGMGFQPVPCMMGSPNGPYGRWQVSCPSLTYGMGGGPVAIKNRVVGVIYGGDRESGVRIVTPIQNAHQVLSMAGVALRRCPTDIRSYR